jgi:hypothetical protein
LLQRTQTTPGCDTRAPSLTECGGRADRRLRRVRGYCHRASARAYLVKHMGTHPECAVFRMRGDVAERLKAAVC